MTTYGEGERRIARALNYLIGHTRYAAGKWDLTDLAVTRVLERLRYAERGDELVKTCSTPQAIKGKP
ncbi:MAG: hypothetical protein C4523_02655 [Myxococcales bacterium]|jgi:hypothetical protein|nr:MAG: hypothetical protein C4523_02655 [Myxococcales bacterium]